MVKKDIKKEAGEREYIKNKIKEAIGEGEWE